MTSINTNTNDRAVLGQALWSELHNRAYNHDGTNDQKFIEEFSRKIPRFMKGCSCNEFWNKWRRENPPVYSREKYFEWTVKTHNAVNTKLGKPTMCLQKAIELQKEQRNFLRYSILKKSTPNMNFQTKRSKPYRQEQTERQKQDYESRDDSSNDTSNDTSIDASIDTRDIESVDEDSLFEVRRDFQINYTNQKESYTFCSATIKALKSKKQFYIGRTNNPQKRLEHHYVDKGLRVMYTLCKTKSPAQTERLEKQLLKRFDIKNSPTVSPDANEPIDDGSNYIYIAFYR